MFCFEKKEITQNELFYVILLLSLFWCICLTKHDNDFNRKYDFARISKIYAYAYLGAGYYIALALARVRPYYNRLRRLLKKGYSLILKPIIVLNI